MKKVILNIPWHKYALIVTLAERMQTKNSLGKTTLQKLVYILQSVYNVPCDYSFALYIYGPFCAELAEDLDYLDALKGVEVKYDRSLNRYEIYPGEIKESIQNRAKDFLKKYEKQIDYVVENFGSLKVRELELCSTAIFVLKDAQMSGQKLSRAEVIREIKGIKPHFSEMEIENGLSVLEKKIPLDM